MSSAKRNQQIQKEIDDKKWHDEHFNIHSSEQSIKSESLDKADDLRVSDATIKLPSISNAQREDLKNSAKTWSRSLDCLSGAIVSVVGAYYRSTRAKEIYRSLNFGEKVSLKLDPENYEDDTAVKVYGRRSHIGYIPSEFSAVIYSYVWLEK